MAEDLVYLFTGDAEIFIKNRIDRIITSYNKHTYTLNKYDMEQTPISKIIEDCITIPFLEELKIIILRNPTVLKSKEQTKELDQFVRYIKNPSDTTLLIIDACNITPSNDNILYQTLKKYAVIIDYSNDEEVEVKGFIRRTCSRYNTEITDDAIDLFLEYISDDQIRMVNELEKVIDYVGEDSTITKDHIIMLVPKDLSKEIYKLISALVNGDNDQVRYIYNELSSQTKDIYSIITLVTKTMKEMLQIQNLTNAGYTQHDVAKFFNVTPGRAYYLIQDAKKFDRNKLSKAVIDLCDLDYNIKSGKVDKNLGFELLLVKIANMK